MKNTLPPWMKSLVIGLMMAIWLTPIDSRGERTSNALQDTQAQPAESHGFHRHDPGPSAVDLNKQVGVDERLGGFVDLDLSFRDEDGGRLRLGEFIQKPTLILPVFFYCPQACSMMLANLASAVNDVPLAPGRDYQILAVSFDAEETASMAREAKKNYWPIVRKELPESQWRFLTGPQEAIDDLLQNLGYRIRKTGPHNFIHPNVLIAVAADGKIIRYLYGTYFLPFDIGMALTEAAKGTPQLSIRRILTYCFDYDSNKRTYVFKSFRVIALAIVSAIAVFLFFLLRKGTATRPAS